MGNDQADRHEGGARDDRRERDQMGRKHIFVVNSAPAFLDLVRELLQDEGYNVTSTNYVPRTFDQIEALGPELLLIDLVVGEQAGWELLEQLQADAATRNVPVIVTSTEPRLLARAEAYRHRFGGRRWMAKPFDLEGLIGAVRELIGPA